MAGFEEVAIPINDVEDVRSVLAACAGLLLARDMETAQINYANVRTSPLRAEIERVKARFDGLLGDFLIAERDRLLEEEGAEDDVEDETVGETGDEPLADNPLGTTKPKRQRGEVVEA